MEPNKPDLSPTVPATYKAIPEQDVEDETVARPKSLVKSKQSTPVTDGADEKMLTKEEQIEINEKVSPNNEKQNGDAKLDIGDLKQAFVGLTKEELMKYANDPFWVRLRWFLFITFWLLWIAMLIGAVMIIYAAPKCNPPPPRTLIERGPIIKIDSVIKPDEVDALINSGIKAVILPWPESYTFIDLDNNNTYVEFLSANKNKEIAVVVECVLGSSSRWFEQSEKKDAAYNDYYIWKGKGENGPPTNWLSPNNKSAWVLSSNRKEYYYAPSGKPHLNLRNQNVSAEVDKFLVQVLDYGAKGIQLKGAPYLLVNEAFKDETETSNIGLNLNPNHYGYWLHTETKNRPELGSLLNKWKTIVRNRTVDGSLMVSEELESLAAYKVKDTLVVDMPVQETLFMNPNLNASMLYKGVHTIFSANNVSWPLWKYERDDGNNALDIVTFLMMGVPQVGRNSTIDNDLLKIRDSASIMRGVFNYSTVANDKVFAFLRSAAGNPGNLVAYNPTKEQVEVNFTNAKAFEGAGLAEVTVQFLSKNYNESGIDINNKESAAKFPMSPNSAVVLSYVPKKEDD